MTFLFLGQEKGIGWIVLFLEHHKSEGKNQEREREEEHKQTRTKPKAKSQKPNVIL